MARGEKLGGLDGLSAIQKSLPSKKNTSNQNQGYKVKDSFDISKTKIPKDTREALKDFTNIENFHLKLYKFARFENDKPIFFKSSKGKVEFSINPNFGDFDFEDNTNKQEQTIKAIFGENYRQKELKISYRLVIGGEASIYETSLRLHHIYGIPYIPASAVKGVVRSYIIGETFENNEDKALQDESFMDIFGSTDQEGKVTFFDAFPTKTPTLKVDIMNPHYGHYYSDGKAPTDTNNPVPINFLTVENTPFKFVIGSKETLKTVKIGNNKIIKWLEEALQNHGIGAKTAVGYGYFS